MPATVSGNLKTLGTTVPGGSPYVRFWLYNTGGNIPRVIGTGVIVPNYVDFTADASGAISGSIYKNSEIDVGGATNTYYHVEFFNITGVVPAADYTVSGATFDITSATPITSTPTVTPPTGDNTYLRLDGGNIGSGFGSSFSPSSNNSFDLGSSGSKWRDGWLGRNLSVGGTITEGSGTAPGGITPSGFAILDGTSSTYNTAVGSVAPLFYGSQYDGTAYSSGNGFRNYFGRIDVTTKTATDVYSGTNLALIRNVNSTNSGGTANDNKTNQVPLVVNCTALQTTSNANCLGANIIVNSQYTGALTQTTIGIEVDQTTVRTAGHFGDASKPYAVGFSANNVGSFDATRAYGADTSTAGVGWLEGFVSAAAKNCGFCVTRNTVTPDTGVWVSAATLAGVYVGAKQLYTMNPGDAPAFDANHNPTVGVWLGQRAANSGQSNLLRFTSTSAGGAEQQWDLFHSSDLILHFQQGGADKVLFDGSGNATFSGNVTLKSSGGNSTALSATTPTGVRGVTIADGNTATVLIAALSTTAATSDNVTIQGMTASGHCVLTATNASAATNIATTYVSAKASNQITVTHTATGSMTYDILCTPN